MYLSTITDCLIEEDYENEEDENEYNNKKEMEKKSKTDGQHDTASDNVKKSLSLPIISASIGEITARDILIAGSANGTYVHSHAHMYIRTHTRTNARMQLKERKLTLHHCKN